MRESTAAAFAETAEPKAPSLVTKLAQVMAAVQRIKKRGHNEHFKYDFATEADIAEAIRSELAIRNVMLVPAIVNETRTEIGKTSSGALKVLTEVELEMTFFDGDSETVIIRRWRGAGVDTEDKGLYKAITGGEKYFLLKTFLIPTGDDPEREDKETKRVREKATAMPDKATRQARKARAPLPEGIVYIAKVIPRSKGNLEWAEIVTSDGEVLYAFEPGCITLATQLAQEDAPVEIAKHRNAKGNWQVDELARWTPQPSLPAGPAIPDDPGVGF